MEENEKELIKHMIHMLCYLKDFPMELKSTLLNKAIDAGIDFDDKEANTNSQ